MTCIFLTDDDATRWALEWLRGRGFSVSRREEHVWLRPRELCAIYGLKPVTLNKRLSHRACPVTPREWSPRGYVVRVAMNEPLNTWLKRPLQKGVAL